MNRRDEDPHPTGFDLDKQLKEETKKLQRVIWIANSLTALTVGAISFIAGHVSK